MTVICLMLLLAIGITACSVGLNRTLEEQTGGKAPYDISVSFWPHEGGTAVPLDQWLAAKGFDPAEELEQQVLYTTGSVEVEGLSYVVGGVPTSTSHLSAISLSNCNALLALQGQEALTLGENEYGLLWGTYEADESFVKALWADGPTLTVAGRDLTPRRDAQTDAVIQTGSGLYSSLLILPDACMADLPVRSVELVGNYPAGADVQEADGRLSEAMHDLVPSDYLGEDGGGYGYSWSTRLAMYLDIMGSKILVLFIGIYLGIIFLLTSAAVLALQQLSQAADNVGRYQILSRLGVDRAMANRSIDVQVFLYFFLPLALAVVHAVVGMTAANQAIAQMGKVDSVASSVVTAVIILVVYGAYFLATCAGSRRIARGR